MKVHISGERTEGRVLQVEVVGPPKTTGWPDEIVSTDYIKKSKSADVEMGSGHHIVIREIDESMIPEEPDLKRPKDDGKEPQTESEQVMAKNERNERGSERTAKKDQRDR